MPRIPLTCFAVFVGLCGLPGSLIAEIRSDAGQIVTAKASAELAPDELLRATTLAVTANLNQNLNHHTHTSTPEQITELVETILPLFNFNHMTRIAMARNWHLASTLQQKSLIAEFQKLLVRTYSTVLVNYRGQVIDYKPVRIAHGETTVIVKSTMSRSGADPMTIDYDMEQTPAGWVVYDIRFSGISLLATYRSTFGQIIRNDGIDGLIQSLSAKNRDADAALKQPAKGAQPFLFIYSVIQSTVRGIR
jgi:phospholipid transport system substrate-binding protein